MWRIFFFLLKLALLAGIIGWFIINPGVVSIEWFEISYDVHIGIAILAIVMLAILAMVILHFFLEIRRLPARWKAFSKQRQEKKGYQHFTEALVALAMDDLETTREEILKAQNLLEESPLPLILTALAAGKENDYASATRVYGLLLKNKPTEFLGYYGLAQTSKKQHDHQASYLYTKKALELSSSSKWGIMNLFQLSLGLKDYPEAIKLMKKIKKYHFVDTQKSQHLEGLIFYLQSIEELEVKDKIRNLQKAFQLDPAFTPTALALSQAYLKIHKPSKAEKVLQESLRRFPHPDVADLYIYLYDGKSSGEKIARAEEVLQCSVENCVVGHTALAKTALEEGFTGIARTHLDLAILQNGGVSPKLHLLAHQLELLIGEDSEFSPKHALYQTTLKKPDSVWQCTSCSMSHDQWELICGGCDQMDTLVWQELHLNHIPSKALTQIPL